MLKDPDGAVVATIAEPLPPTTNNVAEYTALIRALECALEHGSRRLAVYTDSELMARQVAGAYAVKAPHLAALLRKVVALRCQFDALSVNHIPRERNREADSLSNVGADQSTA